MRSSDIFRLNVKELMASQGLKVKDLADMVGLSASYLSLILSGDRGNLSDLHKDAVALALGTTVSRLYAPPDDALFGTAERPADYGRPARFEEKSPGDALSETARFDGRTVAATPLQGRPRDIRALEDFLNVLNIRDPYLLKAIYRELNYLSDREVAKLGQVLLNALVSWQEQAGERQSKTREEGKDLRRSSAPGTGSPHSPRPCSFSCSHTGSGLAGALGGCNFLVTFSRLSGSRRFVFSGTFAAGGNISRHAA